MKFKLSVLMIGIIWMTSALADMPKHLVLGEEIVDHVKPENNSYDPAGYIRWKGDFLSSDYSVKANCTEFVGYLLDRSESKADREVRSHSNWKGFVRADAYYDAIVSGYGFTVIENFGDVQPGDIIIEVYNKQVQLRTVNGYAVGHAMMVEHVEKIEPQKPIIEGTEQWKVTILDSTDVPHGKNDSRWRPNNNFVTGAGRGDIRVYTSNRIVTGRVWAADTAKYHAVDNNDLNAYKFVVGRPK